MLLKKNKRMLLLIVLTIAPRSNLEECQNQKAKEDLTVFKIKWHG